MIDEQDRQALREIIREEVAPLVSEKRLKRLIKREIEPLTGRLDEVERSAELAVRTAAGLLEDIYGDPNKRSGPLSLYERLDQMEENRAALLEVMEVRSAQRHAELVNRIEKGERWIAQRTAVEKLAVGALRLPVMILLRRLIPFALTTGLVLGLAFSFYVFLTGGLP